MPEHAVEENPSGGVVASDDAPDDEPPTFAVDASEGVPNATADVQPLYPDPTQIPLAAPIALANDNLPGTLPRPKRMLEDDALSGVRVSASQVRADTDSRHQTGRYMMVAGGFFAFVALPIFAIWRVHEVIEMPVRYGMVFEDLGKMGAAALVTTSAIVMMGLAAMAAIRAGERLLLPRSIVNNPEASEHARALQGFAAANPSRNRIKIPGVSEVSRSVEGIIRAVNSGRHPPPPSNA